MLEIDGCKAIVRFDSEIEMFRGEFVGLDGGVDFYVADFAGLKKEAEISLKAYVGLCIEDGVDPEPMLNMSRVFGIWADSTLDALEYEREIRLG